MLMEGAYPLFSKAIYVTGKTSRPIHCTYKFLGQVLSKEYEPTWLLKPQNQVPSKSNCERQPMLPHAQVGSGSPCFATEQLSCHGR